MQHVSYAVHRDRAVWDGRLLRDWANDLVDLVVAEFDPAAVILFGSVADGTDGPDSDIDVLVVLDDAPLAVRRDLMVALRRTTRSIAAPHDVLVTSAADLARSAHVPGTLEYEPAQRGVVAYERAAA